MGNLGIGAEGQPAPFAADDAAKLAAAVKKLALKLGSETHDGSVRRACQRVAAALTDGVEEPRTLGHFHFTISGKALIVLPIDSGNGGTVFIDEFHFCPDDLWSKVRAGRFEGPVTDWFEKAIRAGLRL